MKRVDPDEPARSSTSAIGLNQIKIPTSSSITLTPSISGPAAASAAAIRFPARQVIEMPQQPVANAAAAGSSAQQPPAASSAANPVPVTIATGSFQRIQPNSGSSVSVFRGDSVPTPPAAHSGGVALTPAQARSSTQPAPPAHLSQTASQQNKPETIALPTTPVSVQYTSNAFAGAAVPMPPSVKSLTNAQPVAANPSVPGIVHNLTQQQPNTAHQQIVHQKAGAGLPANVSYGPPTAATIRTIASLPASTTAGVITTPVTGLVAQTIASSNVSNVQTATNAGGGAAVGQPQAQNAQFQRLKVEDALSYLDKVKFKFDNQPQVYNQFLDIMKEFKTQSIDTPGVIARVSCLFKGHPELIVGFNTFLPTGYKVEVHCNDSGSGNLSGLPGSGMQTIVHTPHGIHTMGAQGHMSALTTAGASTLTAITTAGNAPNPQQQQQQLQVRPSPIQPPSQTKYAAQQQQQPKLPEAAQFRTAAGAAGPHHLPPQAHAAPIATLTQHHPSRGGDAHSQATLTLQTPHLPVPHLPTHPHPPPPAPIGTTNQPEFNHAINYVNKIKNRFQGQPDVYKQFLEILHTYQRDQKAIKEGMPPSGRQLTEQEVHMQVSKLFKNQADLLQEFSQFLPEAANDHATSAISSLNHKAINNDHGTATKKPLASNYKSQKYLSYQPGLPVGQKRPPSGLSHPPPKKIKTGSLRDVSMAEAGKFATLEEYAFFDKVRKALRSPEVYENFLRCLVLYNQEVINRTELIQLTGSFLNRHSDLFKWFKDFLGYKDHHGQNDATGGTANLSGQMSGRVLSGETAMEVDYATCKRLGKSYCALPKDVVQPICSGRTELCRSVLNDTWVSFPSWSEDSQFVTSRKTQFEEFIYRTEDERFEFDIVLETNKDTIKVLECVQKKMSRMPPEEAARYRLDDCLGGSSPTIHQCAIRRIYGDKAMDIIDGLKRNPVVAVPLVLRRLRAKDEEWREVQKNFNRVWRDQNEKYYLKSLDHQYMQFKQSDNRSLRSKVLLTEIETLYDERHEQLEEQTGSNPTSGSSIPTEGPHLTLEYPDMKILDDANNILIHHVKRQPSVHKDDKHKIKLLLRQFLMDMFKHQRQELSEDERENDPQDEDNSSNNESDNNSKATRSDRARKKKDTDRKKDDKAKKSGDKSPGKDDKPIKDEITEADIKIENKDGRQTPIHARDMDADETYVHIMCNNNWYLFIRLHQILCERLTKMYNQAVIIASEEAKDKKDRKTSTAVALKLKPKSEIDPEDYYPAFLDMVKNLLDGNMDSQAYEDTLREMFGIHAYISFTLDKVVGNAVRQLQYLVTEESCVECYDLYQSEIKNGATGGYCGTAAERQIAELLYQKRAEKLLADENCMKVFVYHQSGKVTIEMLDTDTDAADSELEEKKPTSKYVDSYVDKFIQPGLEISTECKQHLAQKPVFLPRSIRCYNTSPLGRIRSAEVGQEICVENGKEIKKEEDQENHKKIDQVMNEDNTQCVFNPKNFKILYVINSESCFYRKLALTRGKMSHKKVSQRKTGDFNAWHLKWLKKNVSESQQSSLNEWFMGKSEGLVPNKTHKITKSDFDVTPYRTFHRFKAEILKS